MDTALLKKFAQSARQQLLEQVSSRLTVVLAEASLARRESADAIAELEMRIADTSEERVIEQVAYTWFNRFCALRFMDANRYTRIGTVSPVDDHTQPEILMEAKQGHIDEDWGIDAAAVLGLLDGSRPSDDPQQEAYRLLLVAVCNHYNTIMPFMFEQIADYTELLLPDDLLSDNSVLTATRKALATDACQDVEIIGWLYQYYISEKKDDVINRRRVVAKAEIPAATQLFTPHWIVRYLVENSLGRLWMLNHPDSRLFQNIKDRGEDCYYIEPEEPETDFLKINSPETLRVCDPACGSGHMLTYAFDLLYAIYEERGYQATDIPRQILTRNLYGIEIDQRAGALAAFALTMKAREKYRRFLQPDKVVQPHICVLKNISIDPEDLDAYIEHVGRNLFTEGLRGVVNQWEQADNFGSLIRPLVNDVSEVLELLRERQMGEDLFLAGVHQKVLTALRQADYLSPRYHVVVANPPYMGRRGMNSDLKTFVGTSCEAGKSDLFASFMLRYFDSLMRGGQIGFVTPYVWMFIASYEALRAHLLSNCSITSLVQLEYNAFEPACIPVCAFTLSKATDRAVAGGFIRLTAFRGSHNQGPRTIEAICNTSCGWFFRARTTDFEAVSGSPIAYWIHKSLRAAFRNSSSLGEAGKTRRGLQPGDADRFVKYWHEVSFGNIGFGMQKKEAERSRIMWFPFNSGGTYRKWYGNIANIVNWQDAGRDIKATGRAIIPNEDLYFTKAITWPKVSSGKCSFRVMEDGIIPGDAGPCFYSESAHYSVLAYANTTIARQFLSFLSPTLNFEVGVMARLPFVNTTTNESLHFAKRAVQIAKTDWTAIETTWEFDVPWSRRDSNEYPLSVAFRRHRESQKALVEELHTIEQENNSLWAAAFSLHDVVQPELNSEDITLTCNPAYRYGSDKSESELEALLLADTMREFISYAVGCMLGRYSLDKPGLILANQGETADDYRQQIPEPTFAPDEDNVIPLLDGDWFEDDISELFKEFLKVTFGTEHYDENLTFLEDGLYPDNRKGKKRKTIRDYFLKEFYNHHIKLYKKRPIYWMFSSPKGTFNALIYMHRYRPDTVSVVLNDYLREYQTKLKATVDHEQSVADSASASQSEKTKALKRITKLQKDLKELEDYERDILYPLATQRIEIDLDDGVRVNYNKFGKALKKVTGLSGKA